VTIAFLDRQRNLWNGAISLGLAVGMAWPFLLTVAYFGAQNSLSLMLADWFWPLHHYSLANHVLRISELVRRYAPSLFGSGPLTQRAITVLAISLVLWFLPCLSPPWLCCRIGRSDVAKTRAGTVAAHYVLVCSALSGLLLSVVIGRADSFISCT